MNKTGYKLLTQDLKSRYGAYNEMDWSDIGLWHEAKETGGLCTPGMLHDYDDPWIAVVMNPAHANIRYPVMYEDERDGYSETDGLKCGHKRLRLVREMQMPHVPRVHRVAFGIYASLELRCRVEYKRWAENWLSGKDRSRYVTEDIHVLCPSAASIVLHAAYYYASSHAARYAETVNADAADAADAVAAKGVEINWQEIKRKAMLIK